MNRLAVLRCGCWAAWLGSGLAGVAQPAPADPLSVDLETAQAIALSDNPSLQAAAARTRQADARLAQVRSTLFPVVGVGGTVVHSQYSDRSVRELEEALNFVPEDLEQRIELAAEEIGDDFERASRAAQARLRREQVEALRGSPGLLRLQQSVFEDIDRQSSLYARTFESELARADPFGSLVESLGLDREVTVDDDRTTYQAGGYLTWLLFDGFARRFSRQVARYGREESEESRRDAQRLLLGSVARAYYQAQLSREEMTIAKADLDFNARLLDEAAKRRAAGQTSLSTELNFEIRKNVAQTSLVNARRQYEGSLVALAALLGCPGAEWPARYRLAPLQEERPEEMQPPAAEAAVDYALASRPDVTFARLAVDQARARVRLARSAYSPSLNLTGNYSASREDDADFDEDDFGGNVAVILRWDLFEGGLRSAQVREALALHQEAASSLSQVSLSAAAEVRAAIVTLRFAGDLLTLQRRNLSIVERTRDLVKLEYEAGQASLVRLNESQRDLVLARSRYATALASLHVAWHEYLQSTARSLETVD